MITAATTTTNAPQWADAQGRHRGNAHLCSFFHDISAGQAAEEMLADLDAGRLELPAEAGLWVAPTYAWIYPAINLGRKGKDNQGETLTHPARATWSLGQLVLVPTDGAGHGETIADWSYSGLGRTGFGSTIIATGYPIDGGVMESGDDVLPEMVVVEALGELALRGRLVELAEAGQAARFQFIGHLETYVEKALHRAHASIVEELAGNGARYNRVIDTTKMETIANHMLLGDADHPGKVAQLLDRCLAYGTFEKVEPTLYIRESLRRDANNEIRKAIDDPHIGPKVRKVARELGTRDLDAIIEAYRELYPADRLSVKRAAEALSVGADAMATWAGIDGIATHV